MYYKMVKLIVHLNNILKKRRRNDLNSFFIYYFKNVSVHQVLLHL